MVWQARLQKFSDTLGQIHFAGAPQLSLTVNGDARDIHSFDVRFNDHCAGRANAVVSARATFNSTANLTVPTDAPTNFDASWDFWTNTQPYHLAGLDARNLHN